MGHGGPSLDLAHKDVRAIRGGREITDFPGLRLVYSGLKLSYFSAHSHETCGSGLPFSALCLIHMDRKLVVTRGQVAGVRLTKIAGPLET